MSIESQTALVLIELADSDALIKQYGAGIHELILYPEFIGKINTITRPGDTVKNLGSSRVVVVLNAIGEAELKLAINKLLLAFEQPVNALEELVSLNIHLGAAFLEPGKKTTNDALREAGLAMARSRGADRSQSAGKGEATTDTESLLAAVKHGIEAGEFHLYLQPKKHAHFRSLLGVEALLRWHTKDKQVLKPSKFLGDVEKSPLILPLTEWVLKSAIGKLRRWPKSLSIAVNVSGATLSRPELATIIQDALALYDIEPRRLILEVAEQMVIDSPEEAYVVFKQLKKTGVRVSIGDFGKDHFKAYKGLAKLIEIAKADLSPRGEGGAIPGSPLPLDEIKIDRRLIVNLGTSAVTNQLILSIVQLAHGARLKVVGVGVEDEESAKILVHAGCDELQGFGMGMPLPLKEFENQYNIKIRTSR